MKTIATALPGVLLIDPAVHRDGRGLFFESYHREKYLTAGIPSVFVQDNQSNSVKGTLRGLHMQVRHPQAKLVRVLHGEILDVAADARVGSPHFGKWISAVLSADNFRQIYVPEGFLHGFIVTSEFAHVEYKCSNLYDPAGELGIRWNDPTVGADWGVAEPVLSPKDLQNPFLTDVMDRLPRFDGGAAR